MTGGLPADADGSSRSERTVSSRVSEALTEIGADFRSEGDGAFLITLPGERRHQTLVWVLVGAHELLIESFVCRCPDENAEGVYRFLLQRNSRLRTIAYALDGDGDIHLVGRVGHRQLDGQALTAELNTVLGVVLATSDEDFNQILERGFAGAIRREWAWRESRGHSLRNLQAFRHLIDF